MLSIRKNLAYNFLLSVSHVLLPLISIPYVSRVLLPDGIGQVSFIDSFTYYFINIAEFGIVLYGIREVAKHRNQPEALSKLVSELLALHVITSLAAMLLYACSIIFLLGKIHDHRLIWFSVSYLLVNSFACEWYFMGMERFRYITLRSLLSRSLGLLSLFLLVKGPSDYFIYYLIMVLAAIINSIWNNILLFREVKISFRNLQLRRHIRSTRIIYAISLVYGITLMLDNVLLRLVSSSAAVGIYAFSAKLVRTASLLLTDSITVFFPRIVALRNEGDNEKMETVMQKNLHLLVFFAVPASMGIGLLAGPLVRSFLGGRFEASIVPVQILALYPLLKCLGLFFNNQVLLAHQLEKQSLVSQIAGNFLFIPFTLILSAQFAFNGAAIALVLAELITFLCAWRYAVTSLPRLNLTYGKMILHSFIASVFFIPVICLLNYAALPDGLILLIAIPVCMVLYICLQLLVLKNSFAILLRQWVQLTFFRKPEAVNE